MICGGRLPCQEPPRLYVEEQIDLDRFYREGELRAMASPHVHYDEASAPILAAATDWNGSISSSNSTAIPRVFPSPLVRAWWTGDGFVGRCPRCDGWIRFRTLRMDAVSESEASKSPQLPENWSTLVQIA